MPHGLAIPFARAKSASADEIFKALEAISLELSPGGGKLPRSPRHCRKRHRHLRRQCDDPGSDLRKLIHYSTLLNKRTRNRTKGPTNSLKYLKKKVAMPIMVSYDTNRERETS
jgi:hypothetical protein